MCSPAASPSSRTGGGTHSTCARTSGEGDDPGASTDHRRNWASLRGFDRAQIHWYNPRCHGPRKALPQSGAQEHAPMDRLDRLPHVGPGRGRVRSHHAASQQHAGRVGDALQPARTVERAEHDTQAASTWPGRRQPSQRAVLYRSRAREPHADALAPRWRAVARASPSLVQYQATAPLVPHRGDDHGPRRAQRNNRLARPAPGQRVTTSFTVAPGSTLRLQQMVAEPGLSGLSTSLRPHLSRLRPRKARRSSAPSRGGGADQPALADRAVDTGYLQR